LAPRFSVCMVTYQAAKTIRRCFESLLVQLDPRFEVVVVDSESTNGTLNCLKELEAEGRIRLLVRKCTRGEGRQIAAENARGEVLVQQVDADQMYSSFFQDAAERYEEEARKDSDVLVMFVPKQPQPKLGRLSSSAIPSNISFVSRSAFMSKTKWPDISRGEDLHVWDPLIREGHYVEANCISYAQQVKGGMFGILLSALRAQKQLMDSGFSFRWVVQSTRHHGPLFLGRAFMVSVAWVWHTVERSNSVQSSSQV